MGTARLPGPDVLSPHVLAQALFALQAGSDDDQECQALKMMYALCVLAERVGRLRGRHQRSEQAAHARAATAAVRDPRRVSLRERGRRLTLTKRAWYAAAVRDVLPEHAAQILAEPAWDALAATLGTLEASGVDSREAPRTIAGWR